MVERTHQFGIAVGDVAAITAVVLYGRVVSHGQELISAGSLETLGPFLLGWGFASALLGLYTEQAFTSNGWSLRLVTASWFVAAAIGLVARSSPAVSGSVTWPFGLVILGFVLLVLILWRTITLFVLIPTMPETGSPS